MFLSRSKRVVSFYLSKVSGTFPDPDAEDHVEVKEVVSYQREYPGATQKRRSQETIRHTFNMAAEAAYDSRHRSIFSIRAKRFAGL